MLAKSRVRVQPQNSDRPTHSSASYAQKTASEIEQASRIELEQQLKQGRKLLEAKEVLTRRKEYTRFREALNLTPTEGRKRMKLARTVHTEQKPKPQEQHQHSDAVLEKHVDEETGNFYYTLKEVNLSDAAEGGLPLRARVGSALAAKLETQTIGQVLAKASVVGDDYVTNQLQELESVVADVQRLSTENRELKRRQKAEGRRQRGRIWWGIQTPTK